MENLSNCKAVILCGGQGTRIRGVADNLPKPLIDIGGHPILWHIMKIYSVYNIRKFVLCLGYKGEEIIDYFENYHSRHNDFTMQISKRDQRVFHTNGSKDTIDEWEITFALTGEATMTGGRIKRIAKYIDNDVFFCTYGDGVSDVDINALYKYHLEKGRVATLTGVHLPTTFGVVESDADGIVTSFREKPALPGFINGGFFVFNRKIFDYIDDDSTVLEEMPFMRLARSSQVALYQHQGFWHCMDTYKDYSSLNALWDQKKAPWKIW